MEYLSGGELFEQIRLMKQLEIDACRFVASEMVLILEYLRQQHLIHRDLKPENVMLSGDGHIKLVDFGCVKDLNAPPDVSTERKCSFVGTADYVPPETLKNEEITFAADLWGLGCLIYQSLTGTPPFRGATEYLTYQKIANIEYTFPEHFPPAAKDLVSQLLVEDAQQRLGEQDLNALKGHQFFDGIDWEMVGRLPPPSWVNEQSIRKAYSSAIEATSTCCYLNRNILNGWDGDIPVW